MSCTTIDEVIRELDNIVETSGKEKSYLGIFALVYRDTTIRIRKGLQEGIFDDNPRMEALDVCFANLYLEAYRQSKMNHMISICWQTAFDARHDQITLLQHLLLGMNAHINFDLGVAAAEIMKDKDLQPLERDFNKVNDVLAGLTDEMQKKFGRVSRLIFLLDWIGKRSDEKLINFSMTAAREQSWRTAQLIHATPSDSKRMVIHKADLAVNTLARKIRRPPGRLLRFILRIIRRYEIKDAGIAIERLSLP